MKVSENYEDLAAGLEDICVEAKSFPAKGARTTEEIAEKAKLGKTSKNRFNYSRAPMFPFIPIQRVVIDSLHLFLQI